MDSNVLVILLICFDTGGIILKIITVKDLGVCVCARARLVNTSKQGFFYHFQSSNHNGFRRRYWGCIYWQNNSGRPCKGWGRIFRLLYWKLVIMGLDNMGTKQWMFPYFYESIMYLRKTWFFRIRRKQGTWQVVRSFIYLPVY